jgi:uncharacterized protein (UPF0335 family)
MSADARIRSFIDRVKALKDEQAAIGEQIKGVYAEAAAEGHDKTAMGAVVRHLIAVEKNPGKAAEKATNFDLYLAAYERAEPAHAHRYVRGDDFDARTGEIHALNTVRAE